MLEKMETTTTSTEKNGISGKLLRALRCVISLAMWPRDYISAVVRGNGEVLRNFLFPLPNAALMREESQL